MARPFVSVLIDTYNHERFIEEAIVSALEQDFPAADREIIVVDDGSTDHTPEIVRKFDPHVRLLRKENGGQASAFNAGIPECKGEIVAFLDGDDWWAQGKLQTVVSMLENEPYLDAVGHAILEVEESGRTLATVRPNRMYCTHLRTPGDAQEFLSLRAFLGTSRFTARRSLLNRILPVPEQISIEADEFIFTMAAALASVVVLPEPLVHYRLHSNNLYQFTELDRRRMERKQRALSALATGLRGHLAGVKLDAAVIELLVQPTWIDAERLRLSFGEGWSWETFAVERAWFRMTRREVSLAYRLFQAMALTASLLLPPSVFYGLRGWYSRSALPRLRARVADAKSVDSVTVRCVAR